MVHVQQASSSSDWEAFVQLQPYCSFLQSWKMGDVYSDIGQQPIRLEVRANDHITGVCQAIVVPARRGKHLMVQYGPLLQNPDDVEPMINALKDVASEHSCSFIRVSPFWEEDQNSKFKIQNSVSSPLHLLSEYTWYIPLTTHDRWSNDQLEQKPTEESIRMAMRKTTRNLIGRAEREGVTVEASSNPNSDLDIYFALQEETYKRHKFVPYPEKYIRAQVKHFSPEGQAIVYIARYQDEPVAASVHMSYGGITSYHHGASTHKYAKIPASYLLQWTAIKEALERGDDIYNFWGIAPRTVNDEGKEEIIDKNHPFAGVTTFKTGFGGKPLPLVHCMDVPLNWKYSITRSFEFLRKWKRGF